MFFAAGGSVVATSGVVVFTGEDVVVHAGGSAFLLQVTPLLTLPQAVALSAVHFCCRVERLLL